MIAVTIDANDDVRRRGWAVNFDVSFRLSMFAYKDRTIVHLRLGATNAKIAAGVERFSRRRRGVENGLGNGVL